MTMLRIATPRPSGLRIKSRMTVTLTFDSSPIKGEGILLVGLSFCQPALWILAYASMTAPRTHHRLDSRFRGNDRESRRGNDVGVPRPVDSGSSPE